MEDDAAALVSPNVAALAAVTPAVDTGVFFNAISPVGMGSYTLTSFVRGLGVSANQAAFRTAISAMALTDNGAYAGSAASLTTSRSISATGDAAWTVSFNGTANVTAAITLASVGSAGTYGSVTTDTKGRVTAGTVATPIANGGTNATTEAAARANLGVAFTAWANLTLSNSWVVSASRRAAYRSFLDMVQLEVQIASGTATDGTVIGTLPVGFRPAFLLGIPVASGPNTALSSTVAVPRVLINTDGTITCHNCSSAAAIAFSTTFATV
jgi:phage-related tail fiber protein